MTEAEKMDLEIALAECERDLPYETRKRDEYERLYYAKHDRVKDLRARIKHFRAKLGRKTLGGLVLEDTQQPVK